jgi:hypothetical protein
MAHRSETGAAMPAAWRGAESTVLRLHLRPHIEHDGCHWDRFDAHLGGKLIVRSRQPLYDGARHLLALGYAPETLLTIRHNGRDYDSFEPAPIGELAKWTIKERKKGGLQRRRWTRFEDASRRDTRSAPASEAA